MSDHLVGHSKPLYSGVMIMSTNTPGSGIYLGSQPALTGQLDQHPSVAGPPASGGEAAPHPPSASGEHVIPNTLQLWNDNAPDTTARHEFLLRLLRYAREHKLFMQGPTSVEWDGTQNLTYVAYIPNNSVGEEGCGCFLYHYNHERPQGLSYQGPYSQNHFIAAKIDPRPPRLSTMNAGRKPR